MHRRLYTLQICSSKQKADADVDLLKERLRKLEQECDRLKEENKGLHEGEQTARQMRKEEANRIRLLERDLKDATTEVEELKSKRVYFGCVEQMANK